jgi:hypothetical protein
MAKATHVTTSANFANRITFAALPGATFYSPEAVDEYAWIALRQESAIQEYTGESDMPAFVDALTEIGCEAIDIAEIVAALPGRVACGYYA